MQWLILGESLARQEHFKTSYIVRGFLFALFFKGKTKEFHSKGAELSDVSLL